MEDGGVVALFPDVFSRNPIELVADLEEVGCGLPLVGGAASGDPMEGRTYQWCGRELADHGVAGIMLGGDVEARVGVAQGCQPFGQAYTITKADGHMIEEIAFSPAVDILKEALGTLPAAGRDEAGPPVFIGLAMDEHALTRGQGDFLVRHVSLDPSTGALVAGEAVEVGQTIRFNVRTAAAAREDMRNMVGRLTAEAFDPTFGLYFNCVGRGFGLYGQPDFDTAVILSGWARLPFAGFFGNAELAPVGNGNFVHNYTGALVLFG
jgi:small ligand-binding sensory domain FIST